MVWCREGRGGVEDDPGLLSGQLDNWLGQYQKLIKDKNNSL